MTNKNKWLKFTTAVLLLIVALSTVLTSCKTANVTDAAGTTNTGIRLFGNKIDTGMQSYLDSSVMYRLPDTVADTDTISVIIRTDDECLLDTYEQSGSSLSFGEYAFGEEALAFKQEIDNEKTAILSALSKQGIDYTEGADYAVVLSGFELLITAKDFDGLCQTLGDGATAIVGEVYNAAETELVENEVDVYETGIFNSSDFEYDGTGMVVAVLDTGLDYYHSAFSLKNFEVAESDLGLTFEEVSRLVGDTVASRLQNGLTASDVYVNQKVPFGFDYADFDSEVYPLNSHHGTHVSGIIAGKDDVITGVAPNAQLVEMKIFSDTMDTARSSWILNALEDCVILGVDVINMSIGTSCGFSRETDKEALSGVYDRVREAGISMVVAASNSFNSTYGSEKNGNLGLTSNPDSATVGSPSTYEGALCVGSISGTKTPYMLYEGKILYFIESSDRVAEEKNFFDDLLPEGQDSMTIEYVTIPGAGRSADYTGMDVTGKIVLVQRGSTTFEEKANVAQNKGAAGIIIYNNVSGEIKMNVGEATLAACSIGQDDGEMLAAAKTGTLQISRSQTSGPFISDFSSWGPSPNLGIKPEITAHGGSIYSAVPGQNYDRISGTSMATPNVSGVVALLRQYVVENFPEIANDPVAITALVNQLMMSTADIIINKNGLPYSVRKQGAGLANLVNSAKTTAYIQTYDRQTGEIIDKSKIELGDDPSKTGVYTLNFAIVNFGDTALTYDMSYYVFTEGVSETLTNDGKTTVTEEAYTLDGAKIEILSVKGGTQNGTQISVGANATVEVSVKLTLSDADKKYLDESFENGMYVEGYITLDAVSGTEVDLSVPYLAFYGDWTVAPLFDLDYYATNKDELDDAIDLLDKTLPDAYATRPIGGVYDDYVNYLGSYYFQQKPGSVKIAADRKYISLSNQEGAVNSLRFVWAGLLRNASSIQITITDDATGEVIFERVEKDIRKSYGDGGPIAPANVKIEFSAADYNLKNNTTYTVKLKGLLDYGEGGADTNLNNTFEFPLVTDFQAPSVTGCDFYTEYDKTEKITRYFAKVAIYDNHYAMSMQPGYVGQTSEGYVLYPFETYVTPVYSEFNSTTYVVYELTDYIYDIKNNAVNKNCFTVACYDYALNTATYEIPLPDEFLDVWFLEDEITLSPNQVYTLDLGAYPATEWGILTANISSTNTSVARIINNKVLAVAPGESKIVFRHPVTNQTVSIPVHVLGEGDEGYKRYDRPVADKFYLTGYKTEKAYYFLSSDERDIGATGDEVVIAGNNGLSLSMFPSESVTLKYKLDAYFPNITKVVFQSSNDKLVTVDENGKITAVSEGFASVTMKVTLAGKNTYYSETINIEIKDPFITTGASLTHYFGNGGYVHFPSNLAITEIGQFAFSNYDYVLKEPYEVTDEDPELSKIWYIGDNTIEEVVVPEGVEVIGAYAFANLTALKKVTLPSTLKHIQYGAFYNCTSLQTVEGIEHVQLINQAAFANCDLKGELSLDNAIAIAASAFQNNSKLTKVILSEHSQSIGASAFAGCAGLKEVEINASLLKLGTNVFAGCSSLTEIAINAAVLPAGAFDGCSKLEKVTIGPNVAVIGEFAFRDTAVASFEVANGNTTFFAQSGKPYILSADGTELLLASTTIAGEFVLDDQKITTIASGAFAGNDRITSIVAPHVTEVGDYAFADCTKLSKASFGTLTKLGNYAFYNTSLTAMPSIEGLDRIGSYAFAYTALTEVNIPNGVEIGRGAFRECKSLASVTIGNNVTIGSDAFRLDRETNFFAGGGSVAPPSYTLEDGTKIFYYVYTSPLHTLTIGENVTIGSAAFMGAAELESVTLGAGAVIGREAFYNACSLKYIDLSAVKSIGEAAFSGDVIYDFADSQYQNPAIDENGYYIYRFFAPALESVDLSALERLDARAFEYCKQLTTVTLGNGVTTVPNNAFGGCEKLKSINLSGVISIGENAFSEAALTEIDLSSADKIGKYAFVYNEELTSVILGKDAVTVEEGTFSYCSALASVSGMEKVTYVGDYAFTYTALSGADLSAATHIGEHAFMKEKMTDFTVTISEALTYLGDNPFVNCRLAPFSTIVIESANGKDYEKQVYDFDLSDNIKVIEGSLYRIVPNGFELITFAGNADTVTVAEGTVRISAQAFVGSEVKKVILPYTLKAIGHKAFYDCRNLVMVSFSSYRAPILEEEYDYAYYVSNENLPMTGDYNVPITDTEYASFIGLEVIPYFMWNVANEPSNIYYGANFVDYIGHDVGKLVIVAPTNGSYYDSFIYTRYFTTEVKGAAAADDITLEAIAAINALPDNIRLTDKALVEAARAAYDRIATLEQRSLVLNYTKLTQAEKRISDLEYLNNGDDNAPDDGGNGDENVVEKPKFVLSTEWIIAIVAAVVIVGLAGVVVYFVLLNSKQKRQIAELQSQTDFLTQNNNQAADDASAVTPPEFDDGTDV